jgi:hypothetical protein
MGKTQHECEGHRRIYLHLVLLWLSVIGRMKFQKCPKANSICRVIFNIHIPFVFRPKINNTASLLLGAFVHRMISLNEDLSLYITFSFIFFNILILP